MSWPNRKGGLWQFKKKTIWKILVFEYSKTFYLFCAITLENKYYSLLL